MDWDGVDLEMIKPGFKASLFKIQVFPGATMQAQPVYNLPFNITAFGELLYRSSPCKSQIYNFLPEEHIDLAICRRTSKIAIHY